MREFNVGDKYYFLEPDNKHVVDLTVLKVEEKDGKRLIFFISDNTCDYWNGAYSVDESNIGKFIFSSKDEALLSVHN